MGHNLLGSFSAALHFFRPSPSLRQTPWIDDTGDGVWDRQDGLVARDLHWGYPWAFAGPQGGELPFIFQAGPEGGLDPGQEVTLWTDLVEGPVPDGVTATIIPPNVAYTPGEPITGFPTVDLLREGDTWRWSAPYNDFTQAGQYTILFQAVYADKRLSDPVQARLFVSTAAGHWQLY
jgi:hypothetical protein